MLEADYKATLARLQISMQQAEQQSALQVRAHAFTVPCRGKAGFDVCTPGSPDALVSV